MKYADGPTAEVETLVDAPPAVVWALVSDITTPVRFSEELHDVRWVDEPTLTAMDARGELSGGLLAELRRSGVV